MVPADMPVASMAANADTGSSAWRTMSMTAFQQTARAAASGSSPTDSSTVRSDRGSNLTRT